MIVGLRYSEAEQAYHTKQWQRNRNSDRAYLASDRQKWNAFKKRRKANKVARTSRAKNR